MQIIATIFFFCFLSLIIFFDRSSGSIFEVSLLTSTNSGLAPEYKIVLLVAKKEIGVVKTQIGAQVAGGARVDFVKLDHVVAKRIEPAAVRFAQRDNALERFGAL